MEHTALDALIDELQQMIPAMSGIFSSLRMHDWHPVFAKAKEIQAAFKSGVRYPTKRERDDAWVRFNDLRTLAFERANGERSRFRSESESHRDDILALIKHADYRPFGDVIGGLFVGLPPTTVEEMKRASETLKEAGQMLSRKKDRMLKEHKEECFARIQEVRQTHDQFWDEYRRGREERQAQSKLRRAEVADRIRDNLRANRERLEKAEA